MAVATCRNCGATMDAGAAACPNCGIPDPISASTTAGPHPERDTAGSRVKSATKAIGCILLALIVLGIAIVVGVFDVFF